MFGNCRFESRGDHLHASSRAWALRGVVFALIAFAACVDDSDVQRASDRSASSPDSSSIPVIWNSDTIPSCSSCKIQIEHFASIGSPDDTAFAYMMAEIVEGADQRFYVGPMSGGQRIGVFDWSGTLLKLFSRRGEAPGRHQGISAMATTPDSMLVVLGSNIAIWFPLPEGAPQTVVLPYTQNEPRVAAFRGHIFSAAVGTPIRRGFFSSFGRDSTIAFGDSLPAPTPGTLTLDQRRAYRQLTPAAKNRFWAMSSSLEPLVEEWTVDGTLLRRYRLPAPWFKTHGLEIYPDLQKHGIRGVRVSVGRSIWRDKEGRLWTITQVSDPDWALVRDQPGVSGFDRSKVTDAVIAVYEVTDSTIDLLAKRQVDQALGRFLSDSVVAEVLYPDNDVTHFNLFRFRLVQ